MNTVASESKTAIVAAIAGNLAVTTAKFTAAAITGSSAMLSEGIHSMVDTGKWRAALCGLKRSPAPSGRGASIRAREELYFWSLTHEYPQIKRIFIAAEAHKPS